MEGPKPSQGVVEEPWKTFAFYVKEVFAAFCTFSSAQHAELRTFAEAEHQVREIDGISQGQKRIQIRAREPQFFLRDLANILIFESFSPNNICGVHHSGLPTA